MVSLHPLVCPLSVSSSSSDFFRCSLWSSCYRSVRFASKRRNSSRTERPFFFCNASWQEVRTIPFRTFYFPVLLLSFFLPMIHSRIFSV